MHIEISMCKKDACKNEKLSGTRMIRIYQTVYSYRVIFIILFILNMYFHIHPSRFHRRCP